MLWFEAKTPRIQQQFCLSFIRQSFGYSEAVRRDLVYYEFARTIISSYTISSQLTTSVLHAKCYKILWQGSKVMEEAVVLFLLWIKRCILLWFGDSDLDSGLSVYGLRNYFSMFIRRKCVHTLRVKETKVLEYKEFQNMYVRNPERDNSTHENEQHLCYSDCCIGKIVFRIWVNSTLLSWTFTT